MQECFERKTEYVGTDLNIQNNGPRNKVSFIILNGISIIQCANMRCSKRVKSCLPSHFRRETKDRVKEAAKTHLDVTIGCLLIAKQLTGE